MTIKLAHRNREIRRPLLELLQKHALSPDGQESEFVPSRARSGFEQELAPEMTRLVQEGQERSEVGYNMLRNLDEAFRTKAPLYLALINHQSTFENDQDYLANLKTLVVHWVEERGHAE